MARGGFPSMTALLGLLAVAGYQNRDKLGEMLGQRGGTGSGMGGPGGGMGQGGSLGGALGGLLGGGGRSGGGLDSLLGGLAGGAAGGGLGGLLGGGLSEMNDRFRQNGQGEVMDSWVGTGPNRTLETNDLERAIGPDVLDDLVQQTGLSRDDILSRLSRELPNAVDQYTPQGRIPSRTDFG